MIARGRASAALVTGAEAEEEIKKKKRRRLGNKKTG